MATEAGEFIFTVRPAEFRGEPHAEVVEIGLPLRGQGLDLGDVGFGIGGPDFLQNRAESGVSVDPGVGS